MAHDLLSPKKHVDKTYYSKVKGKIKDTAVKQFANGLFVDDELTALPAVLKILSYNSDEDYSEIHVTIHEGKFHQVKRMFTAIGSEVLFLKRITFGSLSLDESLKTGEYRTLTKEEISLLQRNQIKDKENSMVKDFLPISREDMKKGAGSSATSCIYAEMPMLTILLLEWLL